VQRRRQIAERIWCARRAGCLGKHRLLREWIVDETDSAVTGGSAMQDALMLLFTVIFFAVAFLYVKACQKLR
jgi:hypothetical protein